MSYPFPTARAVLTLAALAASAAPAAAQVPVKEAPGRTKVVDETLAARHPLDPLVPAEIEAAVKVIRGEKNLPDSVRFVSVALKEPSKDVVRGWKADKTFPREAFLVLLDKASPRAYEAVVDLNANKLLRYDALPEGTQPAVLLEEFGEAETIARSSPAFREALKKRGIDNPDLVMVDAWSAGHYGNEPPEDKGRRLVRALCWVRSEPHDNHYARPVENLVAVLDLNRKELVRVEDYGAIPLPPQSGNWAREYVKETRSDLKPVEVSQPDGVSFSLKGNELNWQKWSLRVGFNPREGLLLHTVAYDGRPVLYRASIAEMIVPYADPKASSYHKNVFDLGEYGLGMLANSLSVGCDCLGTIRYLDGHFADNNGRVVTLKNAICLHEEDAGLLWKHTDWRNGQSEVRRSRRMTISMIATVGNYDYGFYWYLYQDGSIQLDVKLTGIVNTTALKPGEAPRYGVEVAPQLNAPLHQHFFNARLDLSVDGEANTLEEVNIQPGPAGPENPHHTAFFAQSTPLLKESVARRNTNTASSRFWKIVNTGRKNALGQSVAYRLMPAESTLPYAQPGATLLKRAAFLTNNLWATPFAEAERYPAGEYPNQNPASDGLPKWTSADRDLGDRDLVLWYTFGQTHVPRVEDWPVMPVASVGFMLRPDGFFDRNPSLDVAPPKP